MVNPIDVALAVDARATELARGVEREVRLVCAGRPEFQAIILHAIWRKIERMAADAETRAALRSSPDA